MTSWPFKELTPGRYRVILGDPNWLFATWSDADLSKTPSNHYHCDSLDELAQLPVSALAHPEGAAIVMWTTAPMAQQAFQLLNAWGFIYSTMGPWLKLSSTGRNLAFGTGHVLRSTAEFFLIGRRGQPVFRSGDGANSVRNAIVNRDWPRDPSWIITAPIREHSRKPDEMYAAIETLFAGPYAELFARARRRHWDSWGVELDKFPMTGVE